MADATKKDKLVRLRGVMSALGIAERDIEEKFIRSRGKGGQHLNKTSTCVYLKHLPTGIEVRCQRERSQRLNRLAARQILIEKIKRKRAQERRNKLKRTRQGKSLRRLRRTQEKVLEDKRKRSEKKKTRAFRPERDSFE